MSLLLPLSVLAQEDVDKIVIRCHFYMAEFGIEAVGIFIDYDVAAQKALAQYATEHQAMTEKCREELGRFGAARIKLCADLAIDSQGRLEQR